MLIQSTQNPRVRHAVRLRTSRGRRSQGRTIVDGVREEAGRHAHDWDGKNEHGYAVASGVYTCRLDASGHVQDIRLVRVR